MVDPSKARTTTATAPSEGRKVGVVHRLVVALEPSRDDRRVVVLDNRPLVLGRDAGAAGLCIHDQQLSRQHARIEREGTDHVIVDLDSHNGTYVDGARTRRTVLRDGAVLRVGRSLLVYSEADLDDPSLLRDEVAPLYGPSPAMARLRGDIERVAATPMPVLLLGESGVGKELAAQALHAWSGRKGPFVPVNCAALAADLAEAELFGHEAGSFTGAVQRREGLFAAAANGTLFLDEIGEMPLLVQPKLLRALALGEVRAVGSSTARHPDVRIVAATNRDLDAAARDGSFRGDLLARLAGWTLRIPPLRARREDILPLAKRRLGEKPGRPQLSAAAAEALLLFDYPYNVRDLEHEIDAAHVRWRGDKPIGREHLSDRLLSRASSLPDGGAAEGPPSPLGDTDSTVTSPVPRGAAPSENELRRALERSGGNVARVAALFGRDRHQVYRWIEHLGLDVKAFRGR